MKTNVHFLSDLAHFFLEWEMFDKSCIEKMKTQILCSITSPPPKKKIVPFVGKCCRVGAEPQTAI